MTVTYCKINAGEQQWHGGSCTEVGSFPGGIRCCSVERDSNWSQSHPHLWRKPGPELVRGFIARTMISISPRVSLGLGLPLHAILSEFTVASSWCSV